MSADSENVALLRAQLARSQAAQQDVQELIDDLQREITSVKNQSAGVERKLKQAEDQMTRLNSDLLERQEVVRLGQNRIATVENELRQQVDRAEWLQQKLDHLAGRSADQESVIEEMTTSLASKDECIAQLQTELDSKEKRTTALQDDLCHQADEVKWIQHQMKQLSGQNAELESVIADLTFSLTIKDKRISELDAELETKECEQQQLQQLGSRSADQESVIEQLTTSLASKDQRMAELEAELEAKENRLVAAEDELCHQGDKAERLYYQLELLGNQGAERESVIEELTFSLSTKDKRIGELETELRSKERCVEQLEADIDVQNRLIHSNEQDIRSLRQDLLDLQAEHDAPLGKDDLQRIKELEKDLEKAAQCANCRVDAEHQDRGSLLLEKDAVIKELQQALEKSLASQITAPCAKCLMDQQQQQEQQQDLDRLPLVQHNTDRIEHVQQQGRPDSRQTAQCEMCLAYRQQTPGQDHLALLREKDDRIEELQEALRESVRITAEREVALDAETTLRSELGQKVSPSLNII